MAEPLNFRISELADGAPAQATDLVVIARGNSSFNVPLSELVFESQTLNSPLHVAQPVLSGATANVNADDIVIDGDANVGMSLLASTNGVTRLYFGTPTTPRGAGFDWNPESQGDSFKIGTVIAGGDVDIRSGAAVSALMLDGDQNATLRPGGSGATASVDSDDLVVESASANNVGMTILGNNLANLSYSFGTAEDSIAARTHYVQSSGLFKVGTLRAGGQVAVTVEDGKEAMRIAGTIVRIQPGDSGAIADAAANDLLLEGLGATGTGMSILTDAVNKASILALGNPTTPYGAEFSWTEANNQMRIATRHAGSHVFIATGNAVEAARFTNDQRLILKNGVSGAVANLIADDFVVEGASGVGMSLLAEPNGIAAILMGDSVADNLFQMSWIGGSSSGQLATSKVAATVAIHSGTNIEAVQFTSDQRAIFGRLKSGVVADVNADNLVIEGTLFCGMSILGPDTHSQQLYFGSPDDNAAFKLTWNPGAKDANLITSNSASRIHLRPGSGTVAMTLTGNQLVQIKPGTSGATANTAADDLVIEHSSSGGASILVPDLNQATFALGSPSANIGFQAAWRHDTLTASMGSGFTGAIAVINSGNNVEAARFTTDQRTILKNGTSGAVAGVTADDLVLDLSGPGGITIMNRSGDNLNIDFNTAKGALAGRIQMADVLNAMQIGTTFVGGGIRFLTDNGTANFIMNADASAQCVGSFRAEGYTTTGAVPGANFSGAVTNITIIDGIVTAAS